MGGERNRERREGEEVIEPGAVSWLGWRGKEANHFSIYLVYILLICISMNDPDATKQLLALHHHRAMMKSHNTWSFSPRPRCAIVAAVVAAATADDDDDDDAAAAAAATGPSCAAAAALPAAAMSKLPTAKLIG